MSKLPTGQTKPDGRSNRPSKYAVDGVNPWDKEGTTRAAWDWKRRQASGTPLRRSSAKPPVAKEGRDKNIPFRASYSLYQRMERYLFDQKMSGTPTSKQAMIEQTVTAFLKGKGY